MKKLTYGLLALVLVVTNVTLVTSTASATQTRIEAESMYRDYGTREIVYDKTASANYKRVMTTNGGAWNYFSSTTDFTQVDFRAKATQYGSAYPQVDIWIDSEYHSSVSIDSSNWKMYSIHGDWSEGTHTVYFDYVNDRGRRAVHLDYAVAAGEKAPTPSGDETGGSGGAFADLQSQSFTGNGETGKYHIYADHLDTTKPIGLLVQLHGDGAAEFNRPTSGKLLGMNQLAEEHNLLMIAARTPTFEEGDSTFWQQHEKTTGYIEELIQKVAYEKYNVDKSRVWFSGYSGGAEFLTYWYVGNHNDTFTGGGALISGGGGANQWYPGTVTASDNIKNNFRMHWYSGQDDISENAMDGFCGICGAQKGEAYYKAQGFKNVTSHYPAGVNHYNLDEVRELRKLLDEAYN